MDALLLIAYDKLAPADQLIIDAMVITLVKKDKQISDLVAHVHAELDAEESAKRDGDANV